MSSFFVEIGLAIDLAVLGVLSLEPFFVAAKSGDSGGGFSDFYEVVATLSADYCV